MDWISWPVTVLVLAAVSLVLSSVGNEIRRRRKFRSYCEKVVAELRSPGPAEWSGFNVRIEPRRFTELGKDW